MPANAGAPAEVPPTPWISRNGRVQIAGACSATVDGVLVLLADEVEAAVDSVAGEERDVWNIAEAVGGIAIDARLPGRLGVDGTPLSMSELGPPPAATVSSPVPGLLLVQSGVQSAPQSLSNAQESFQVVSGM